MLIRLSVFFGIVSSVFCVILKCSVDNISIIWLMPVCSYFIFMKTYTHGVHVVPALNCPVFFDVKVVPFSSNSLLVF